MMPSTTTRLQRRQRKELSIHATNLGVLSRTFCLIAALWLARLAVGIENPFVSSVALTLAVTMIIATVATSCYIPGLLLGAYALLLAPAITGESNARVFMIVGLAVASLASLSNLARRE